jgi:hypothetical protein
MVDGAARLYCRPEIHFKATEWNVEGKKVVEFLIGPGENKPYMAHDQDGRWVAYIRQGDQNFKASRAILKVWEKQKKGKPATVRFRKAEKELLDFLEAHSSITISRFQRLSGLSNHQAEMILVDFILIGLLRVDYTANHSLFSLTTGYQSIVDRILPEE